MDCDFMIASLCVSEYDPVPKFITDGLTCILGTVTHSKEAFSGRVPACSFPVLDLYKSSSTDPCSPPPKYKLKSLILAPGTLEFCKSPHYLGGQASLLPTFRNSFPPNWTQIPILVTSFKVVARKGEMVKSRGGMLKPTVERGGGWMTW